MGTLAKKKKSPAVYHMLRRPHTEQHEDGRIYTKLSPLEAEGLGAWLLRAADNLREIWVSVPPVGNPKPVAAYTQTGNVLTPQKWRMIVAKTSQNRMAYRAPQNEPPPTEPNTPNLRARFQPLAEARVSAVLAALDYFGQLAQRARYRYTDLEVAEMFEAIDDKVAETKEAFRRGVGNRPGFRFRK